MKSKLAIKRLTASDLTLFEWHFRHKNAGNQKAINLNADVFVGDLFPSLPRIAIEMDGRIPIDLYVYGPRMAGELNLQRKIVKSGSYKNWRLDGEFIYNPEAEGDRFNCLQEEDLALMEFVGESIPVSIRALFLSHEPEDDGLRQSISTLLQGRAMSSVSEVELDKAIRRATAPAEHPIRQFLIEAALEDAAQGGPGGIRRLRSVARNRRISKLELQRALRNCNAIGEVGESIVSHHLSELERARMLAGFKWISDENAISPFDFEVTNLDGSVTLLDVKTTRGEFERPFHISLPELEVMASAGAQYDIYRIFDIEADTASLRIARDAREFARRILDGIGGLPNGVEADSFSVDPRTISFGEKVRVRVPEPVID